MKTIIILDFETAEVYTHEFNPSDIVDDDYLGYINNKYNYLTLKESNCQYMIVEKLIITKL